MALAKTKTERRSSWPETVFKAIPNSQCAGVVRAIDGLWKTIENNPNGNVHGFHEIVHNTKVVKDFKEAGTFFSDNLEDIPDGSIVMVSAHGASPLIFQEAEKRGMRIIDATCPLVAKVHKEIKEYANQGFKIILIGHKGHDEVVGTIGVAPESITLVETLEDAKTVTIADPEKVALTMQTTLSVEDTKAIRKELKRRFPKLVEPEKSDICYATQNRQDAVKEMVRQGAEAVVVVGSPHSSNSNRLREVGGATLMEQNKPEISIMIDDVEELENFESIFASLGIVGITSGASVSPENLDDVIKWFKAKGTKNVRDINLLNVDESRIRFAPIKQ